MTKARRLFHGLSGRLSGRLFPPERVSPCIHWVLQGELAVGCFPTRLYREPLGDRQIQVILSLCSEWEGQLPPEIRAAFCCLRVPMPDSRYTRPLEIEELSDAVDLVHWHLQRRRPVYVHCWAGMERSPLVCLAYLCRYRHLDWLDALAWMKQTHPPTQPTGPQLQVVRAYLAQVQHREP